MGSWSGVRIQIDFGTNPDSDTDRSQNVVDSLHCWRHFAECRENQLVTVGDMLIPYSAMAREVEK